MCDDRTERDIEINLRRRGLTRREFGASLSAAALLAMLPPVAGAADVVTSDVMVPTPDGEADGFFAHPSSGAHAGVIMWPDVKGIRPAFRAMGERLAKSGYAVLVVNPYYRMVHGDVIKPGESYGDPDVRARLQPYRAALSPQTCVTDGGAFIDWLDANAAVDSGRMIGTAGYCMTGSYVFRLAAAYYDRVGAGCSFHGGGLATDAEDSPHRLVNDIEAGMLVAIAENDDERDPEAKVKLRKAFADAGKSDQAEIEVYEGTLHGWCPPDGDAYNEAQAEKAWARMLALFGERLA